MKLAFSRPTETDAEQHLLFSQFGVVGYDGLQLKAGQFARYVSRPEEYLREWGDVPGATSALITGGTLDEAGIHALRRLFIFAEAVKAERIVFCHNAPRDGIGRDEIQDYARILCDLGEEAAQHSVRLSIHHHFQQPVMHRDDFRWFFDAARPGTVGLTVDTAHLVKSGIEDIAGLLREFAPFVDNIHLKDFEAGEFRVLGEGRIDFDPFFAVLRDIGYEGWLCADEESGSDLISGMETCHRFISERLLEPS